MSSAVQTVIPGVGDAIRVSVVENTAESSSTPPATVPRGGSTPGLVQALATANTDPGGTEIPNGTKAIIIWFATSSSDPTPTSGRVAFDSDATAIGSITGTDTLLGYQGPIPYQYSIPDDVTHLHVACATAGAVCYGMWLS